MKNKMYQSKLSDTLDNDTYSLRRDMALPIDVDLQSSQVDNNNPLQSTQQDENERGVEVATENNESPENNEQQSQLDHRANLLSQMKLPHFFEGAEKRLVIYFKEDDEEELVYGGNDSTGVVGGRGSSSGLEGSDDEEAVSHSVDSLATKAKCSGLDLRKITRSQWKNVLDLVHCRILNVISNEHYDAYLLSESSLFVSKRSFLLKTCGSTTLLHCLDAIMNVIFNLGFDSIVENVFYSHKNLLLPSLQKKPHNSFMKESEYLDKLFNGNSHLFGHINADRWYLYMMDYNQPRLGQWMVMSPSMLAQHHPDELLLNDNEHFKFEMIMEDLNKDVMRLFYQDPETPITAAQVTRKSGIDSIIPGMVIDDYLFSPCGYSMNGLLGKHYMTIHITPEPEFSYVSVETNVPQKSYSTFIDKLLKLFKPGKFMLNLFVPSINYLKSKNNLDHVGRVLMMNEVLSMMNICNGAKHQKSFAAASYFETAVKVHGFMIYEALSCCGSVGFNSIGSQCRYRRCDFQMAHSEHLDIIYARYVTEGIS